MSKLSKIVFVAVVGLCVLPHTPAGVIQYDYSASVLFESRGDEVATIDQQLFSTGDAVSGSFTYDNSVSSLPEDIAGTIYFAMTNLLGSINGNSFSDPAGIVAVVNYFVLAPEYPDSFIVDFLTLDSGNDDFETDDLNGFTINNGETTFELVFFRLFNFELTVPGLPGFLEDESLPGSLIPFFNGHRGARLELGFVDVSDENNTHRVTADSIIVTAVPVPAAIWMFLSAVGLLGVASSRRKQAI